VLNRQYWPVTMPEAAAILLPAPERRRRGGQAPFVPTKEARDAVAIMAALGASEQVMLAILRRNDVPCRSPNTLRKHFREELKQGREHLVTALGLKMVSWATGDGPHAFSACAFLLRTLGGWQWRVPKDQEVDDLRGANVAAVNNVRFYLPSNGRENTLGTKAEPVSTETAPVSDETASQAADEPERCKGWTTIEI
jgi:hypothetical protein